MSKRKVTKIDGIEKELLSETERVELFISKYWLKVAIVAVLVVILNYFISKIFVFRKKNG